MPIYCFKCEACGTIGEVLGSMRRSIQSVIKCSKCGGPAIRNFQSELAKAKPFQPYTEENFDGKSVDVTSSRHRDRLCKKHGVTYDSMSKSQARVPQVDLGLSEGQLQDIIEETQGGKILPDDVKEACKSVEDSV